MPVKGGHLSDEAKAKISTANKGRFAGTKNPNYGKHMSPELREKLLITHLGQPRSKETREKISVAMKGRFAGDKHPQYGRPGTFLGKHHTSETKTQLSEIDRSGENNPRWMGGISFEPYCPKFNDELKQRIREFFENRCVMCGKTNPNKWKLCCHHVTYNKEMCCDGKPVQFAALCHRRHSKTSGGDRQRWEDMLHRAIDEIWDGKSYFTKEEYAELMK
jgi:hypothetical protein